MPRPLFWPQPRLDPLPIVFEAVGDLGPAGRDRLAPLGLATSKRIWKTARQAGRMALSPSMALGRAFAHGGSQCPSVFSESGTPSSGHLGYPWALWKLLISRGPGLSQVGERTESSQALVRGPFILHRVCCCQGSWLSRTCRSKGSRLSLCCSVSGVWGSVLHPVWGVHWEKGAWQLGGVE